MKPISFSMPKVVGKDTYYTHGQPNCPVAHLLQATGLSPAKTRRWHGADMVEHEEKLAEYIAKYNYNSDEVLTDIHQMVFNNDEPDTNSMELLKGFLGKYDRAFYICESTVKSTTSPNKKGKRKR